jgi:EmrB/QacA subfamily drug resistance transporter
MTERTDWLLLTNAMLGQFITGFAARSFVVASPTIADALGTDILVISWAIIAYQLAGICLSVVFGRLGDLHGRHAIYGAGFVVMTASAVLCALAPTALALVMFRLVQGVGAAMIASATRVLAMESMPEHAAGKANGFMTMSFHGGVLLGPPVGGFLIDLLSWRWIFFSLAPIGAAGIVLTALRTREHRAGSAARLDIDYVGAALLVALTLVLTALLDRRSADAAGVGQRGFMVVAFAGALLGFLVHERRTRHPVVNLALFRIRMFTFSVLSLLVVATTTSVLMLLLPFYMQGVLHESASFMGLIFLTAPVFTITLAPVSGYLVDRVGPRGPTSIGVILTLAAFVVAITLSTDSGWPLTALVMALMGLGQGFFNTSNQTALLASVPREYRGFATGLVQMVFGLGTLLGTALGSGLLTVMFRYASGVADASPSPEQAVPFVTAMNATCAVSGALTLVALAVSVMRGGARVVPPSGP